MRVRVRMGVRVRVKERVRLRVGVGGRRGLSGSIFRMAESCASLSATYLGRSGRNAASSDRRGRSMKWAIPSMAPSDSGGRKVSCITWNKQVGLETLHVGQSSWPNQTARIWARQHLVLLHKRGLLLVPKFPPSTSCADLVGPPPNFSMKFRSQRVLRGTSTGQPSNVTSFVA